MSREVGRSETQKDGVPVAAGEDTEEGINREVMCRNRGRKGKKWEAAQVGDFVGEVSRDICVPGRFRPIPMARDIDPSAAPLPSKLKDSHRAYGRYVSLAIGDSHTEISSTRTRASTVSASRS